MGSRWSPPRWLLPPAASLLSACSAAVSTPTADAAALLERLNAVAPFESVSGTSRPSGSAFDPSDGLELREAERAALVLHPSLRAARARAEIVAAAASAGSGFPNPTLEVGVQGVVESVPDPWKVSVGIGFSIPLSDRLGAETRQLDAQSRHALWEVVALERRHQRRLRRAWVTWSQAVERSRLLGEHLGALDELRDLASRLANAGELSPAGLALFEVRRRAVERDRRSSADHAELASVAVRRLIGIRGDAPVTLVASLEVSRPEPAFLSVTALPSVRVAQAGVALAAAAEARVGSQVTPDLTLSATFEHDRGNNAVGALVSAPLPIFDRLGRARAEAKAAFSAASVELEAAVLDAQAGFVAAERGVVLASAALERANEAAADVDQLMVRIRALALQGEVDLWAIQQALEERLAAGEAVLAARAALALAHVDLASFARLESEVAR